MQLQETVLFTINSEGLAQRHGTTWKRDKEYISGAELLTAKPKRQDCTECILKMLTDFGGSMRTAELEKNIHDFGYSYATVKRAKDELKANSKIEYYQTGSRKDKVWHTRLTVGADTPTEMGEDFTGPWNKEVEQITMPPSESCK